MDSKTSDAYERHAQDYAARHRTVAPDRIYKLVETFFHAGAVTADIGCGSGRDTKWLTEHGFQTIGYDNSAAMRREARRAFQGIVFEEAHLPELNTIPDETFDNVLCSAVLMHLPRLSLLPSLLNVSRILKPGGRLVISFRNSQDKGERESDGRLFTSINPGQLLLTLEAVGCGMLFRESQPDASRAGVIWETIVVEKEVNGAARGLERIQSVLTQDRMTATYKPALIRGLALIARTQSQGVHWHSGDIFVPMRLLAATWIRFFWPIFTFPTPVSQVTGNRPIGFRHVIERLIKEFGRAGLFAFLKDLDERPDRYETHLRDVAATIRKGPIAYAGTSATPVFRFASTSEKPNGALRIEPIGWVVVPEPMWLDLVRFNHWIEDSIVLRWARLTNEMNPALTLGDIVQLMLATFDAERDTYEIRQALKSDVILQKLGGRPMCVWTGEILDRMDIDHVIPFAMWGNNDLWNLLPAHPRVNNEKRDSLPSRRLLQDREGAILQYWKIYHDDLWGVRFGTQIGRALGSDSSSPDWAEQAFVGLIETVERLALTIGAPRWTPSKSFGRG